KTPEVTRNHIDELGKLPFSLPQRRLDFLVDVDVDPDAVPSGDAPLDVVRGPDSKSMPNPLTRRAQDAVLVMEVLARPQGVAQGSGCTFIVIGMHASFPTEVSTIDETFLAQWLVEVIQSEGDR